MSKIVDGITKDLKAIPKKLKSKTSGADTKKLILLNLPYILAGYFVDKVAWLWRICEGDNASDKLMIVMGQMEKLFTNPLPSFHPKDLLIGVVGGVALRLVVYFKAKNAKKFRQGVEYGSARWGNAKDIEPYMDEVFENNVLLTQTERLMMSGRPKEPKYARNKNILVIGGSGSGKGDNKGAWTTEIANQDTKEFEEYHLDVRYFTDRDEIVDVSKVREQQAEENLSIMGRAEALIGELEANKTLFTSEERNLIVNYAYKTDDFDKTKALAEKLALMEDKGLAGVGKVMAEAQAEIDDLPDPMIGLCEMHDYGYDWSEMLPLTKDRALELWDDDFPIYLLHVDGSETMADDREEIEEHGGIFGIEKEDWMRERSLERDNDIAEEKEAAESVMGETVSEKKSNDTYQIYQLKSDDELWQYHFENLESLKDHDLKVEGKNYELKYEGEWTEGMHLDGIYAKFNIDRPEDFTGHSLSVGDIVVLNRDGKETAHFVDSVGFVEVPEFFLESVQEQTREEMAESIEDGDEIIDLGDDRETVLAEICGSKEVEVQDTSGQDVQKQKPEVEITLTVAECGEFHNMGELYENIPTVDEAIALFEKIPPERMNGIPAIGINLHRAGEDAENDIAIDLVGTKSIDLDVLQYVPDIANEPKAMEVVAELIAKLPDREIDGNLSPELEAKVWEIRMPQLSEEEKLAVEFDRLWFDYDRILYGDSVRSMTENVEELTQEIKTEGTERMRSLQGSKLKQQNKVVAGYGSCGLYPVFLCEDG